MTLRALTDPPTPADVEARLAGLGMHVSNLARADATAPAGGRAYRGEHRHLSPLDGET